MKNENERERYEYREGDGERCYLGRKVEAENAGQDR